MFHSDIPQKIQGHRSVIDKLNSFLATPQYVMLIMLLAAASNLFALELGVYTVFAGIIVYVCLFGQDLLPLMPVFVCCYLAPSVANNPGHNDESIFFPAHGGIWLIVLAVLMVIAAVIRVVRDREAFFRRRYALLPGLLALLGAYLLSGIGSAAYPAAFPENTVFALIQGGSFLIPYFLLSGGVDWKRTRKDYFAWVGFGSGCLLLLQILWIYLTNHVIIDGIIHRGQIYTGWGMHNNLGGMLAMMIPFAFYLATKYRRGWIGTVAGSAFLVGVLLTCSRTSIVAGTAIYLMCVFLMLYYARNRRHNTIALVSVIIVVLLILVLFHRFLLRLFSDLLRIGLDPSSRDIIFQEGLALFRQAPLFGSSFFSPGYTPWDWSTVEAFSAFFPPRWHNTVVQLLASCGIAGLLAYLYHRFQTVRLFLRRRSKETVFISCSVAVLLICSLFDCHLFNVGPALFYAMALAFGENCPGSAR